MTFGEAYNFADKIADEIIGGTREMSDYRMAGTQERRTAADIVAKWLEGESPVLHLAQLFQESEQAIEDLIRSRVTTLTARIAELEQENAKLLDEVTARRFTDDLPLKDRIKELDAELLADGVTMITHPPTAPPAESVEDAKAFKRVAIELRIRFPVEIQYNSEFEAMVKRLEGGSL